MKKGMIKFFQVSIVCFSLALASSCAVKNAIMDGISGKPPTSTTAQPSPATADQATITNTPQSQDVPATKTYSLPQASIVEAIKGIFSQSDLMCNTTNDGSTIRIISDDFSAGESSQLSLAFGGSNYSGKHVVEVAGNGQVTFRTRFTKAMFGIGAPQVTQWPEKEKEYRINFFANLDKRMAEIVLKVEPKQETVPVAAPKPKAKTTKATKKK